MDIPEIEGMKILKEHDHSSNYWPGEEGMNMTGIQMVEGMDMVEERPPKERPKVEGMDMKDHPFKERPEVEGIDIVEDMTTVVVEREHEDVVLMRHWIGDGAKRYQ
jgi:hypothetical protein